MVRHQLFFRAGIFREVPAVVVGNEQFLLPDQFPVETVERPVEDERLVVIVDTRVDIVGGVVPQGRCLSYPTLAGQVLPCLARAIQRVDDEELLASLERRVRHEDAQQLAVAVEVLQRSLRVVVGVLEHVANPGCQNQLAFRRPDIVGDIDRGGFPGPGELVIPHRLITVMGDRERDPPIRAFDIHTAIGGPGPRGIGKGIVIDPLRSSRSAVRRIHIQPVALGIFLQQRLDPIRQLIPILIHVPGIDGQQRFLRSIGIRPGITTDIACGHIGITAFPAWNGALLITCALRTERRQGRLQLVCFIDRDRRVGQRSKAECTTDHRHRVLLGLFHYSSPSVALERALCSERNEIPVFQ
ncbi:hypothetical protein D9M68_572990 [compost metagenome]